MKTFFRIALIAGAAALSAQAVPAQPPATKAAAPQHAGRPLLGVYVSAVHPALANNLHDLLSPEQGLIVEQLSEDSPAGKAGIKVHDILTTYDDQKLFAAEQLAKLVQADKPGKEVRLGYLRDGKLQKVQVKLAEAQTPPVPPPPPFSHRPPGGVPPHPFHGFGHMFGWHHGVQPPGSEWENFDSLTLKKLGENKFRAEVQYLDKDGKPRKHVFEGTRDELRKAIIAEKDLKATERAHLLHVFGLQSEDELPFPSFWFGPGPQGWFHHPADDDEL